MPHLFRAGRARMCPGKKRRTRPPFSWREHMSRPPSFPAGECRRIPRGTRTSRVCVSGVVLRDIQRWMVRKIFERPGRPRQMRLQKRAQLVPIPRDGVADIERQRHHDHPCMMRSPNCRSAVPATSSAPAIPNFCAGRVGCPFAYLLDDFDLVFPVV